MGRLTATTLPHHRTYGSVSGGSRGARKSPLLLQKAHEAHLAQQCGRYGLVHVSRARVPPLGFRRTVISPAIRRAAPCLAHIGRAIRGATRSLAITETKSRMRRLLSGLRRLRPGVRFGVRLSPPLTRSAELCRRYAPRRGLAGVLGRTRGGETVGQAAMREAERGRVSEGLPHPGRRRPRCRQRTTIPQLPSFVEVLKNRCLTLSIVPVPSTRRISTRRSTGRSGRAVDLARGGLGKSSRSSSRCSFVSSWRPVSSAALWSQRAEPSIPSVMAPSIPPKAGDTQRAGTWSNHWGNGIM